MLDHNFFNRKTLTVARELIGKVIHHRFENQWLSAMIIETEAYEIDEKASHSSLGYTNKRAPLFMAPGTIYMYYARGGDSLCISTAGEGNAVLLKSGIVFSESPVPNDMTRTMQRLNPPAKGAEPRPLQRLCSGQTLLCRSLNIKVKEWDGKIFDRNRLYIDHRGYIPETIIQARRLGIREERDSHLLYRFIDERYSSRSTKNILTEKKKKEGEDYNYLFR